MLLELVVVIKASLFHPAEVILIDITDIMPTRVGRLHSRLRSSAADMLPLSANAASSRSIGKSDKGKQHYCVSPFLALGKSIFLSVAALLALFTLLWVQNYEPARDELKTPISNNNDFDVAKRESLGFFDDIPSRTWDRMKTKVKDMSPNFNKFYLPFKEGRGPAHNRVKKPGNFYQNNYEPDFVCQHERRIGRLGDGGKWICDPHRISDQEDCLVYSVGSNNDFSFEQSVLDEIGPHCEIHTFDFGNYQEGAEKLGFREHKGQQLPAVNYHKFGLGTDGGKFKSLKTVVDLLGHTNRTIDIFKIDCEGCEWSTAYQWFEADVTLRQIQVELHQSDVIKTPQFFDLLYENNYVITHKESNIEWTGPQNVAIEYALLKLAPEFFAGYDREKGAAAS